MSDIEYWRVTCEHCPFNARRKKRSDAEALGRAHVDVKHPDDEEWSFHLKAHRRNDLLQPDDLLGMKELTEYVGLSKQRIYALLTEGRFPEPFVRLECGKIWRRQDLDAFMAVSRAPGKSAEWPSKAAASKNAGQSSAMEFAEALTRSHRGQSGAPKQT